MRKSWDTSVKHYFRLGLEDTLPREFRNHIAPSNISRWKTEPESKYIGNSLTEFVKQDLELYKRIGQTNHLKKINESYIKLLDTYQEIISSVKGIKATIKDQKELVVNIIEQVKNSIPIDKAIRVFNISRTTYQNYKTIVIHKCEASYFKWCTKRFPNQLLPKEVLTIKEYMEHIDYMYWSKASVYLRAVRDENLKCCISTFYKYCRLLGFNSRRLKRKSDDYEPIKTTRPNELWCADVTIFKTGDGVKHYIHFLMDHYSKMILGYRVEKSSSGKAVKSLLQEACLKYKPQNVQFLTDAGTENINTTVSSYLNTLVFPIKHIIAQRDVVFSNSMVESLNKVIKHQFLHHRNINTGTGLIRVLDESVLIYNNNRPQWSLDGNTPFETFSGTPMDFSRYSACFKQQKALRLIQNQNNSCKTCF